MINNVLKNIALSCSLTVMSMSLTASDVPIEQYLAPLDIRLSLDTIFKDAEFKQAFFTKNKQKLAALGCTIYDTHWGNVVVEHKNLPGYLIKGEKPLQNRNWKRVLYGQEIRDAIGNNSSFLVATEYLY